DNLEQEEEAQLQQSQQQAQYHVLPTPPVSSVAVEDTRNVINNANYLYTNNDQSSGIQQQQQHQQNDYMSYGQNEDYSNQGYYDIEPRRKKLMGKRELSPFLQQNTDSLESRDDELKDSFETAVSSVSSSFQQLKSSLYSEYSTAGEPTYTNTTMTQNNIDTTSHLAGNQTDVNQRNQLNASIYQGDHTSYTDKTNAIVSSTLPSVTVAQVHNQTNLRLAQQNRVGLVKQQETIDGDSSYYRDQSQKMGYTDGYDGYDGMQEPYLESQDSVESYVEEVEDETEGTITNGVSTSDYTTKTAIHRDSPICSDLYDDDTSLRRGSSQITVVDPYHPALQNRQPSIPTTGAATVGSRRSSGVDNYYNDKVGRRTSSDSYGATYDQQQQVDATYPPTLASRKSSAASRVPSPPSIVGGTTIAPPLPSDIREEYVDEYVEEDEYHDARDEYHDARAGLDQQQLQQEHEVPSVKIEDTEGILQEEQKAEPVLEEKQPKITAQQRWLWAYNKIIMQLDLYL
ncbi:unnamed protein product, partial [Callosobruchus maculatus]